MNKKELKKQLQKEVKNLLTDVYKNEKKFKDFTDNILKQTVFFRQYSFYNTLLLYIQKRDFKLIAGFKKWQELGRKIKKGENALYVFAPVWKDKKKEEEDIKELDEDKIKNAPDYFILVPVFDISQTTGPEIDLSILAGVDTANIKDPEAVFNKLLDYLKTQGIKYKEDDIIKQQSTTTIGSLSSNNIIKIHKNLSTLQKIPVLLHEIGHYLLEHLKDKNKELALKEIEAELFSYASSKFLEIDITTQAGSYIVEAYNYFMKQENGEKLLYKSVKQVIDTATRFLKMIFKTETETPTPTKTYREIQTETETTTETPTETKTETTNTPTNTQEIDDPIMNLI